jgi:hypothetical protein
MKPGKKPKGFTRSIDPLEYSGMKMKTEGQWRYDETTPDEFLRPWLPYIEGTSEDNLERFVYSRSISSCAEIRQAFERDQSF